MAEKESFGRYAAYYDILYQDKDYTGETKFVSELIQRFRSGEKQSIRILDLGCGTGRHAMELAGMGYSVEGADISEGMLKIAAEETLKRNLEITYYKESFQTADRISNKYDVIITMFAGINYLVHYEDLAKTFKNIHTSLLDDDGIFIFDFWNGNAVIDNFSPVREKRMSWNNKEIIRKSETTIDRIAQTSDTKFSFKVLENGVVTDQFEEEHVVRYYFLQEMSDLLRSESLNVIFRCPFLGISREVDVTDWNITYVAKKAE